MARESPLRQALTFGGQAPLPVGGLIVAMAAATLLGSAAPALAGWLTLQVPSGSSFEVLLEAWRLFTWPFFQGALPGSVLTLLFAGFMLLWLGRQLCFAWSEGRFLLRFFVLTGGSGLLTLLTLAPFGYGIGYYGIWAPVNALLVTWGLIFPRQRLSWFGAIEMTGEGVARLVAIGTPVWAFVVGPPGLSLGGLVSYLPHLYAVALAWLLVTGGPRRVLHRLDGWWRERRLASARRRFKVVDPGKPPRSWMN
jgi:hypothetical protein